MTGLSAAPSSGSRATTRRAPEKGGAQKSRAAKVGDWLATTRQTWEQTANRALEQAGREPRGSTAAAWPIGATPPTREGDLERAAALSREPNVHLRPGAVSREKRGRGVGESVAQAAAREAGGCGAPPRPSGTPIRRQVARLEQEIAGVGARLKETYDRVRRALDARIQHAGRAIRAGAAAAQRAGRELGRASATLGRAIRTQRRTSPPRGGRPRACSPRTIRRWART